MPSDFQSTENWKPTASASWTSKSDKTEDNTKGKKELAKVALQKKAGNVTCKASNKEGREPQRALCVCSPTSHAGSFRCHLHRGGATGAVSEEPIVKPPPVAATKPNVTT